MTSTNSTVLKVMEALFSLAFVELCLKSSVILVAFLGSLFVSSEVAKDLYFELNLYNLYSFSKTHYISTVLLHIALTGLQAFIAYMILASFSKFKLSKPFNKELTRMFLRISHFSLGAGILALIANGYCKWIMKKGITIPIDWSAHDTLFFAGVIYLIALVFKKGADLQTENDLTI